MYMEVPVCMYVYVCRGYYQSISQRASKSIQVPELVILAFPFSDDLKAEARTSYTYMTSDNASNLEGTYDVYTRHIEPRIVK